VVWAILLEGALLVGGLWVLPGHVATIYPLTPAPGCANSDGPYMADGYWWTPMDNPRSRDANSYAAVEVSRGWFRSTSGVLIKADGSHMRATAYRGSFELMCHGGPGI